MAMACWVGAGIEVVDDMHAGQSRDGGSHVGRCRSPFRVRGGTLMTPVTPPSWCTALGRVELELVDLLV